MAEKRISISVKSVGAAMIKSEDIKIGTRVKLSLPYKRTLCKGALYWERGYLTRVKDKVGVIVEGGRASSNNTIPIQWSGEKHNCWHHQSDLDLAQ
jgi:hypothetical protein